eukprot:1180382-Prorocentrum_minimum.AAC.1
MNISLALTLALILAYQGVSLWLWIDPMQLRSPTYLLAGKTTLTGRRRNSRRLLNEFAFFSSAGSGSLWATLFVDGTEALIEWDSLPKATCVSLYRNLCRAHPCKIAPAPARAGPRHDVAIEPFQQKILLQHRQPLRHNLEPAPTTTRWAHVHLEAAAQFDDELTLMSNWANSPASVTGNLRGLVTEVYVWSRVLTAFELARLYQGWDGRSTDGSLLAYYNMEEGYNEVVLRDRAKS